MREFCLIPLAQREPNIIEAALQRGGTTIEVFKVNLLSLGTIMNVNESNVRNFLHAEALKYMRIRGIEERLVWAEPRDYYHSPVLPERRPEDHAYWESYEASIGAPLFHNPPEPPKPKEPTFMELLKAVE